MIKMKVPVFNILYDSELGIGILEDCEESSSMNDKELLDTVMGGINALYVLKLKYSKKLAE